MHKRRSPSPSYRRRRSPSPRRRSPPRDRDRDRDRHGSSRHRDHSRDHSRDRDSPKERGENELPVEFSRDRDEERRKVEDNKNVLEKMEKAYSGGPLSLLYQASQEKWKLKIWTRNFKEVRGICTGYVTAFDKHWNLAMTDVDEICLKPKKGKSPFLQDVTAEDLQKLPEAEPKVYKKKEKKPEEEKPEEKPDIEKLDAEKPDIEIIAEVAGDLKTLKVESADEGGKTDTEGEKGETEKPKKRNRKKKKNKIDKRHVNKLFIRGDNIVMLCVIDHGQQQESEEASD